MSFDFFNGKFLSICCVIGMCILIFSLKQDLKIDEIMENGKLYEFFLSEDERNKCRTPRGMNRHVNVIDLKGENYNMLIRKKDCLSCANKIKAFYLEDNECIHELYQPNMIFRITEYVGVFGLLILSVYYFFKK